MNKRVLLAVVPVFFVLITGCGSQNKGLQLPLSAKSVSANTIEIPFPYVESTKDEEWLLNRDLSNHFVVQVINEGRIEKTFSVDNKNSNDSITLGGQEYIVKHITLNSDNQSGIVTLVKH